jgi:undecaprenyl diphosphate synthase
VIWDVKKLPSRTQNILADVTEKSKFFWNKTVILALVYGWQDEIIRWIKKMIAEGVDVGSMNQESFRLYLDSWKYPKPDLIIRTWGDMRHSWFLLYDSAYSEYFFSEKMWPEFDSVELDRALSQFEVSKRNFGK